MNKLSQKDCVAHTILSFIIIAILGYLFIYVPLNIFPAEDAAILFQFSENFAQTGSITYNLNGVHAEGATDFLWMIILGIMNLIGFDTYIASTVLSMFALLGTAYLLYKMINTNNKYYFYIFIFLLLSLPMTPAAIQGFSPLFFGFFITLSAYFLVTNKSRFLFLSTLLLTLVRPDGIVFATPLIVSFFILNKDHFKDDLVLLLKYFIVPGIIYFIWRWSYFGEFLPLPFYVKSNFDRYLLIFNQGSLETNKYILKMFIPLLIFSALLLIKKKLPKYTLPLIVSLLILPYLFYSSMLLSQNVSYRFQYSFILGVIIIFSFSLRGNNNKWLILLSIFVIIYQIISIYPKSKKQYFSLKYIANENITYLAKGLNKITTNAKMAITEAGRLPYYSKWKAVDTWGLNTPQFAKNLIQPEDIKIFDPDLVVIHARRENYNFLTKNITKVHTKRTWDNMCENVTNGINRKKYTLFMVPFYISGKGRHDAYFLKNDFKYYKKVKKLLLYHKAISFEKYTLLDNFNNSTEKKLLLKGKFDIYQIKNKLFYIKNQCKKSDTKHRFFLHIYPFDKNNLLKKYQKHGFENMDFTFNTYGVINNGLCVARRELPQYKIQKIQTGQYAKKRDWGISINVENNSSL